jgi:23S rRNA pseudouridine1911/1915/1917 synthase
MAGPESQSRKVSPELAGPLDRAVRVLFGVSWGKARSWIEGGKVRLAGVVMLDPTTRVRSGEEVDVHDRARRPRPDELSDDQVVYVDAHLVVVNKPPGLSTVPYDQRETDTLDARVRAWLAHHKLAPRRARPNLGVVQRLDKDTSGVVVFTRTWLAKQSLSAQFRRHSVHRRYFAVVHGELGKRTIRTFLVEDRGDGRRGSARGKPPPSAREAITHVEPIERLAGATLVACRLETGRTHQIRIHLAEAGHPLAGERVYVKGFVGPVISAPRLMLHAAELGFVHPATETPVHWETPAPEDMATVLSSLRHQK